ncbi:carbohydrate kinase family protein [Candidatus Saccharibacteria bacterium]|nr:carbohydrate kinase family protein [Candidatus Saccharibacteria bacterium]
MARIVSLGSALCDIYLIDHDDLQPVEVGGSSILGRILVGSKVDIDKLKYEVGGGGLNSAITFSRYGHEAIVMANIGHDAAGEEIMRTLDREDIDNTYMNYTPNRTTGTSVILLDSKRGERTILTYRGASEKFNNFDPEDLELLQPDWLYITTLRGDFETLEMFIDKAQNMGAKIMFNPGEKELADSKKLLKILGKIDVLLVNKLEASKLVPGNTLAELIYRLNNYTNITIITDGPMGGIAGNIALKETYRFGIYEDVKIRDATGAGDAFGSGFLAAYASGKSFRSSLVYASANSTAAVSKIGASTGLLTGRENLHPMPIQKI